MLKSENPVVGGTVLRRQAIQSPNFVSGSAGWAINQDGSSEFNNAIIRNGQVISGTSLFYNGPPAAGNLLASISAAAGTDNKGNAYVAGIFTYTTAAPFLAIGMANSLLFSYKAASQAGPWTSIGQGSITFDNAGNTILNAGTSAKQVQITLGLLAALQGASITGGLTADTEVISSGQAAGHLLDITNTTANPAAPNARITCAAAADPAIGVRVSGDAFSRLLLDTHPTLGGRLRAGTGAAALDTVLYEAAAAQWAADPIAFNNAGAAETLQAPTFQNGWANSGAPGAALQFQRVAAPNQGVQWVGRITAPNPVVANITLAVPAAYRPAHTQPIPARNITTGAIAWLSIGATGILTFQSGAAVGDVLDLVPTVINLIA